MRYDDLQSSQYTIDELQSSQHTIDDLQSSQHNIDDLQSSQSSIAQLAVIRNYYFLFIYYKNKQHVHFNQNLFAHTHCMVYCVPAMATFMIFSYLVVFSQFHKYMKNWTKNIK